MITKRHEYLRIFDELKTANESISGRRLPGAHYLIHPSDRRSATIGENLTTLGQHVAAVNALLAAVYGREVRLSSLFTELGASAADIDHLRKNHISDSCSLVTTAVAACFAAFRNGDRDYHILSRRLGLDGQMSTLEEIGEELGVTRERVRQLEVRARRKCRVPKNRLAIETALQELLQTVRSGSAAELSLNKRIEGSE